MKFLAVALILSGLSQGAQDVSEVLDDTARWLSASALPDGAGWPVSPASTPTPADTLYSGSPGVALFLFELGRVRGEPRWTELARSYVDSMARQVAQGQTPRQSGLYVGLAGWLYTFLEARRICGDESYAAAATACASELQARARRTSAGARLSDVTDVIAGDAGVGMALLYSARVLERRPDLALAESLGWDLLDRADATAHGLDWAMTPTYARRMPNFSHGTAGVATFLVALFEASGQPAFLGAARAGAEELVAQALKDQPGFALPHHRPGGESLVYLGWCHGPAGTARLFRALARATGEPHWAELEASCAQRVLACGAPARRSEGLWNTVGRCCGDAGLLEFLLDRWSATGEARLLAAARAIGDDILTRSTRSQQGTSWLQAEHRVQPQNLQAQTGLMQGAAGVGLVLLRLEAALASRKEIDWAPPEQRAFAADR